MLRVKKKNTGNSRSGMAAAESERDEAAALTPGAFRMPEVSA
jgi:hypothetical protein